MASRVAIFGPHPLLTVAIERRGEADDVHLHAGGQGVWVARMAAELGAEPLLCSFQGGEAGAVLGHLLHELRGQQWLVSTAGTSGCYVVDRRNGEREVLASALSPAPSRHELDDLFSITASAALAADALVVANPFPPDVIPLELFADLVSDVRAGGTPVLVDLSSPRLDSALEGAPDLVKLNDWELAEYVAGPVDGPRLRPAAERLREAGAGTVIVTRGAEPGLVLNGEHAWELIPPHFERGSREGCGDTMMGALAAGWAAQMPLEENVVRAAAAGAANFLRHGLGTGTRNVIEDLVGQVRLQPL
jgi:1-phosphofructokinase